MDKISEEEMTIAKRIAESSTECAVIYLTALGLPEDEAKKLLPEEDTEEKNVEP